MARDYQIKGTNEYLYWAVGLLLLCLWAVRDAWFPSAATLAKHPLGDPESLSFYWFNKILAALAGAAAAVCAFLHRAAR